MRHLIDSYIRAEEAEPLSSFEDMSLVEILVREGQDAINRLPKGLRGNLAAEAIKPNIRRLIVDRRNINPAYYDKMSNILQDLIHQANDEAISYQEYLEELIKLAKMVIEPQSGTTRPSSISTKALAAIYDNVDSNESLAIILDERIKNVKQDGWKNNRFKKKQVLNEIKNVLKSELGNVDEVLANNLLDIAGEQNEY
jgi:type I restriction enzyme R subunit